MTQRTIACNIFMIFYTTFTAAYNSAGVVPVFRADGRGSIEIMLLTHASQQTIANPQKWDSLYFSDISAVRARGENPALTAARAFFDQQTQYKSVEGLARAIAHNGQSFDMGNDHVTYFFPIQSRYIKTVYASEKDGSAAIKKNAIIALLNDLFDAINYASKNAVSRGVKVHDQNGNLWTLLDKFVQGLTRNKKALYDMRLTEL